MAVTGGSSEKRTSAPFKSPDFSRCFHARLQSSGKIFGTAVPFLRPLIRCQHVNDGYLSGNQLKMELTRESRLPGFIQCAPICYSRSSDVNETESKWHLRFSTVTNRWIQLAKQLRPDYNFLLVKHGERLRWAPMIRKRLSPPVNWKTLGQ